MDPVYLIYLCPAVAVLALGFKRVIVPAKKGFSYEYKGQTYDLPDLWTLWKPDDFEPVEAVGLAKICGLSMKKFWPGRFSIREYRS